MDIHELIQEMGRKARAAAAVLRRMTTAEKNAALAAMADALEADSDAIYAANAEDVAAASLRLLILQKTHHDRA